jgi:threonine/homoserine/homoserine lactone efflux protein
MPLELLGAFFISALLLALVPGPDNVFVLGQSLVYGRRAGLLVVLGLCSGLILHTALVALGLATILLASPVALMLVKSCGAVYLLYLAFLCWRDSSQPSITQTEKLGAAQLYRRGLIMNASNPKVAIFFLAFLPQFVDPAYGRVSLQVVLLGLLFMLSTVLVFGAIALLAGYYSAHLQSSARHRRLLNRLVSVIFVLLALNLIGADW